jgi:prepilin-type N-terminal cleavage/methylation domain-containing protein
MRHLQQGKNIMRKQQSGFTLIEIAIVLVIIGLLLGGVLKGQELITGARVRNLIQQQDGVKAAYFGFLDRYRALPGDYASAKANISNVSADGNANGQIELSNTATTVVKEAVLSWEHLSKAGFINGSYVYDAAGPTDASNPKNPYAGFMQLVFDGIYGTGITGTPLASRHNLKTGPQVPVEIVAELDRKVDDGAPYTGSFQFSTYNGQTGTAPAIANCIDTTVTPTAWNIKGANANCGGASLY